MAGTIKTDVIQSELTTPTVFRNSNGTEIGQLVKAWINFNGVTPATVSSFNVSSATRASTGLNSFNFSVSMADGNYCSTMAYTPDQLAAVNPWPRALDISAQTSSTLSWQTAFNTSSTSSYTNFPTNFIKVSR